MSKDNALDLAEGMAAAVRPTGETVWVIVGGGPDDPGAAGA